MSFEKAPENNHMHRNHQLRATLTRSYSYCKAQTIRSSRRSPRPSPSIGMDADGPLSESDRLVQAEAPVKLMGTKKIDRILNRRF